MKEGITWTPEMKEQLVSLYRRNFAVLEIAERIGVQFEQVKGAIARAKRGVWGGEIQAQMLFKEPSEAINPQENATYSTNPANEETPEAVSAAPTTTEIDMIGAIDVLTACAKLFGAEATLDSITFKRGDKSYTLSIFGGAD